MIRSKSLGKKSPVAVKQCLISRTVEDARCVERNAEMIWSEELDFTTLNETQEALRSSEQHYREILDNLMEGVSQTTLDGRLLMANNAFARILGYDSPASLMASVTDMNSQVQVDPDRREELIAQIKRGPVKDFEAQVYRKDGSTIWVSVNSRPSYDADGAIHHIETLMIDISDRREADETLRRNELEARRTATEKEAIAEIGRIVGSSLDIESVYRRFADEAYKLIEFERISINLVDHESDSFIVAFATAFGKELKGLQLGERYPLEGSLTGDSFRDRTTLIFQQDEVSQVSVLAPSTEFADQSFLCTPLIFQDLAIGAVVFRSLSGNTYEEKDIRLAEEIGNQIAGAIGISQMYRNLEKAEEAQRKSQADVQRTAIEQAAFAEIGRTIGSSLEIVSVYERFAEEARQLIAFDQLNVSLADPNGETTKVAFTKFYGAAPLGRYQGYSFPLAGTITEATMQKRGCIVSNGRDAAKSFTIPSNYVARLASFLSVPLIFQDRSIGALLFLSSEVDAFDEKDIRLAEGIANQIAGAIGISQMYADLQRAEEAQRESEDALRDELERAARIQVELLPSQSPVIPHFGLAARCVPARDVAGDFFDWHQPNDNTLDFVLCDVMGKGMPAALLMATVRSALRASSGLPSPAQVLRQVERAIGPDLTRAESFVTLFYGRINIEERQLTYVDAGHGLGFIRRTGGSTEPLQGRNLPLGVLPGQELEESTVTLQEGDMLVLFTDGLVETQDGSMLDVRKFIPDGEGPKHAETVVDSLIEATGQHRNGDDDATILVLTCASSG